MSKLLKGAAVAVMAAVLAMFVNVWLSGRDEQKRLRATLEAQKEVIDDADAREKSRAKTLSEELARIEQLKRSHQTPLEITRELGKDMKLPSPLVLQTSGKGAVGGLAETFGAIPSVPPRELASPTFDRGDKSGVVVGGSGSGDGLGNDRIAAGSEIVIGRADDKAVQQDGGREKVSGATTSASPSVSNSGALLPSADLKPLYNYVQTCRACELRLSEAQLRATDDAAKIAAITRERDAALRAAKGGTLWRRLKRDFVWFAIGAGSGAVVGYAHSRR